MVITLLTGCGASRGESNGPIAPTLRGRLRAARQVGTLSRARVNLTLPLVGLGSLGAARYDVDLWALEYETAGLQGELVTATGLAALPRSAETPRPLLSYFHGTVTERGNVPSNPNTQEGQLVAAAFASYGYVVLAPDYVGLGGSSAAVHGYEHADSLAAAGVDLLRAGSRFLEEREISRNGQLFLSGYSEGGYAAMATHRALERDFADTFPVTASAPLAGPYNLSEVTSEFALGLSGPISEYVPAYVAGILVGYSIAYAPAVLLTEIFQPSAAALLPNLFNGRQSLEKVVASLPASPDAILQPEFLRAYTGDPGHPLRLLLRQNDVDDWRNQAPIRLYHGGGDRDVPIENAYLAAARMSARGGSVEVVNLGDDLDHGGAVIPAVLAARAWFDSLSGL